MWNQKSRERVPRNLGCSVQSTVLGITRLEFTIDSTMNLPFILGIVKLVDVHLPFHL